MGVVSVTALANGAGPLVISRAFGDGFWSLIPFTMQMAFVVIGGYVVASSAPAQGLIRSFAAIPGTGVRCWPCGSRGHAGIAAQYYTNDLIMIQPWVGGRSTEAKKKFYKRIADEIHE